jgi:hypothetical protein
MWSTWIAYGFFVGIPTIALIVGIILGWDLSRPGIFGLPSYLQLLGGYFFMLIFMPLLQLFQLWSSSRNNRTLLGIQTQTFSSEGISVSGETYNTNLKWESILKAIETRHFLLLYFSNRGAFFVPKSQFEDISKLEELRRCIISHLGKKAKLNTAEQGAAANP